MTIMEADLRTIAKKHELEGVQKDKAMLSLISALEVMLDDVYGILCPNSHDYANRRDLIRIFNVVAREIYGDHDECPVVEAFGSFLMDMFSAKSDLDLSINFRNKKAEVQRKEKIKTLRIFMNKLHTLQKSGHVTNVQPILSAKVPVLKVTDRRTGVECDFSVGNMDGIAKSHIVHLISAIDERFQKLSFLMKAWAKAHDINSSKDGTLNSLSLVLLVAFHLQSRDPPILPPFSAIFEDGADPAAVEKSVSRFSNYGKRNKESIAELFVSLLVKLESVEMLWEKGLCASVYEGSWIYKTWPSKKGEKIGCMSIEDFRDRSQNTARAVRPKKMSKIYTSIRRSMQHIRTFTNGQIDTVKLKNQLFSTQQQPDLHDHTPRKRKRDRTRKSRHHLSNKAPSLSLAGDTSASLPSRSTSLVNEMGRFDRSRETLVGNLVQPLVSHNNRPIHGYGVPEPQRAQVHSWSYAPSNFPVSVPYPMNSRSSVMPHHPPNLPYYVPYTAPPIGLQMSYDPHHSFSFVPSPFVEDFHAHDNSRYSRRPMPNARSVTRLHIKPNHHHQNPNIERGSQPPHF